MATWTREELTARRPKDVPMWARSTGSWTAKIKGKHVSLGGWGKGKNKADQERRMKAAAAKYRAMTDKPTTDESTSLTVSELRERFLRDKRRASAQTGKPKESTIASLERVCDFMCDVFGSRKQVEKLTPDDWTELAHAIAQRWSAISTQSTRRIEVRSVLRYADTQRWISTPPRYGQNFESLKEAVSRHQEGKMISGEREYFTPEEFRQQLDNAQSLRMRACLLLAVNCGMSRGDVCAARFDHIKSNGQYVGPRTKPPHVTRQVVLWRRTLSALEEYRREERMKPPRNSDDAGFIFTTHRFKPQRVGGLTIDAYKSDLTEVLERCGQTHLGIFSKGHRKLTATLGEEVGDSDAVRRVLGQRLQSVLHKHYAPLPVSRLEKISEYLEKAIF